MAEKQKLMTLMKVPGNNKCIDCDAPYPQWASANVGVFMCLECSGVHRGLGVQVSFVRSCTMDKWTPDQVKRMDLGGNARATAFFATYPEYRTNMPIKEKYNAEFAEDYREKLLAECDGKEWIKTARPAKVKQASIPSRTSSPASMSGSGGAPRPSEGQRAQNEAFFGTLGSKNATRSTAVPPSQGGKYVGFGSEPEKTGKTALDGLAQPEDPLALLSRGWGFFSKTVASTAKTVQEQYLQPGIERIQDPKFTEDAKKYVDTLGQKVQDDARYAYNSASRFVEGQTGTHPAAAAAASKGYEPVQNSAAEKRNSWDGDSSDW